MSPSNNNSNKLDKDSICSQEDENKENQKQSPMSPGTYAARKSSPTPSFTTEGNIEKEQNRTVFGSKSLSPKTILNTENNNDSGIKTDNTDEDCDDDESDGSVGGATSEDDEYEEDGSEEGGEGFSSSLSPSPPHNNSGDSNSITDLSRHHSSHHHQEFQSLSRSQTEVTSLNPKVIVEHQPLPSIYDLQQMSAACDNLDNECNFDSGLSEDESCCGDSEDDDSDTSGEDLNLMMPPSSNI